MKAAIKDQLLRIRWWMLHPNQRQVRRWLYRRTRPSSYPYISGDGFRRLARHIYDETNRVLSPEVVRKGDLVFVATDYVPRFFTEVAPRIKTTFRLITHNSDLAVDESLGSRIPERAGKWFAQNVTHAHPRIVPIPIGLENLHHYHAGVPGRFSALRSRGFSKKPRILVAFAIQTNPAERGAAHASARRARSADLLQGWPQQAEYVETLSAYEFVLSPPGNGLDTHRTWEAMYLGVVPIVRDSVAMRSFLGRGLPLWIVEEWAEVEALTESELHEKYQELKAGFNSPVLHMDYWRDLVRGARRDGAASGDWRAETSA